MKARRGLFHFLTFGPLLLPLRVMADALPISDAPADLPVASRRSDTQRTCKASLLYEAWYDSEASKTVKTTSYSTCIGTVSPVCVYACVNAGCYES